MLKAGKSAPDFSAVGINGEGFSLRDSLARGPLLLIFFKVSCPTSQFTAPFAERLYQQILPHGGQIIGISQDPVSESRQFADKFGLTFPILLDEKPYKLSKEYGLKFVPALFLVGDDHGIVSSFDGFSKPDMEAAGRFFAKHFSTALPPMFPERVPQYKPG